MVENGRRIRWIAWQERFPHAFRKWPLQVLADTTGFTMMCLTGFENIPFTRPIRIIDLSSDIVGSRLSKLGWQAIVATDVIKMLHDSAHGGNERRD